MSPEQHLEAFRFTAWSLEFSCAVVAAHYVWLATTSEFRLPHYQRVRVAVGLCLKASGWCLQQFFWWVWQHACS